MVQHMPLHVLVLFDVSSLFVGYWWALLAAPAILFVGVKLAARANPLVRYQVDRFKLALPVAGEIMRKIILSRFASIFALMYSSGITFLDDIRSSVELTGNMVIQLGL